MLDVSLADRLNADGFRGLFEALPSVRIILVMGRLGVGTFRPVVEEGVHRYLLKHACHQELCRAIRTVAKGGSYVNEEEATQSPLFLQQQPNGGSVSFGLEVLSSQEQRIIAFIAEGDTNRE